VEEDPKAAAALLAQQTEDWKALVKGYTSLPINAIASNQVLYPPAFAVGTNRDGAALLSAVRYGKGRVVVAGHEGLLERCCFYEDLGGFTMNAIAWAAGNASSPRIATNDGMYLDAINALSANKVRGVQGSKHTYIGARAHQRPVTRCLEASMCWHLVTSKPACASMQTHASAW
jgi:hypothetical protein